MALPADIFAICNGCGSAQAKFDFVPDTIYGLSIAPACYIHDWEYATGTTQEHKDMADIRFLTNMLKIIENNSGWGIAWLRRRRAYKYFDAVRAFGDDAFYKGEKHVQTAYWWFHAGGVGRV